MTNSNGAFSNCFNKCELCEPCEIYLSSCFYIYVITRNILSKCGQNLQSWIRETWKAQTFTLNEADQLGAGKF